MPKSKHLQYCYILKNEIHNEGIAIHAIGEDIIDEINYSSPEVKDLFLDTLVLESDGLWLWKGYIKYDSLGDIVTFEKKSLKKVSFATLDKNAQQDTVKET